MSKKAMENQSAPTATYTCGACGVSMRMEQPAPAQQEPLTEQAFEALYCKAKGYVQTGLMDVVRMVEHHHGIKENT